MACVTKLEVSETLLAKWLCQQVRRVYLLSFAPIWYAAHLPRRIDSPRAATAAAVDGRLDQTTSCWTSGIANKWRYCSDYLLRYFLRESSGLLRSIR